MRRTRRARSNGYFMQISTYCSPISSQLDVSHRFVRLLLLLPTAHPPFRCCKRLQPGEMLTVQRCCPVLRACPQSSCRKVRIGTYVSKAESRLTRYVCPAETSRGPAAEGQGCEEKEKQFRLGLCLPGTPDSLEDARLHENAVGRESDPVEEVL